MIQFEEEIKKFYKSPEIGELEEVIYNQDMTDATDLLFKMMQQDAGKRDKQEIRSEVLSLWLYADEAQFLYCLQKRCQTV